MRIRIWFVASIALIASLLGTSAEGRSPGPFTPLSLGGHLIGEKLAAFRTSFPTAACGVPVRYPITRHSFEDAGKAVDTACCVDDQESLVNISPRFKIVYFQQCEVVAWFHKNRLTVMDYTVDVSSIESILPSFLEPFGEPMDAVTFSQTSDEIEIVTWSHGEDWLCLELASLPGPSNGPGHKHSDGVTMTHYVQISLWTNAYFSYH
jgi:hypothetical protein